jgi:Zn-dependent peptidase ImmA (M78 family)/DNA-binding XRE family transcriptional regulator
MFNPSRLSLARRRRGFTKVQLAERAGVTVRSITGYETGKTEPLPDTVQRLADAAGFPLSFFEAQDLAEVTPDATTFRALSKLTAAKRDQALAAATLALDLHRWITERFRLPALDMPDHLSDEDPERAAQVMRMEWKLGEKPVPNMVHLLEAHGVRVFSLAEDYAEVDAFSFWHQGIPFVFLNTMKSAERSRMDAAHELAHLILHRHGITRSRSIEEEAKRFASAFLMPRNGLRATALHFPTLDQLIVLKRRWKVSVAALALRLHEVGALSDWHYRSLCIDISRKGYRKHEPNEIRRESSLVLKKVFTALRAESTTPPDIAHALHLPSRELSAFIFGLVMLPLEGSGESVNRGGQPELQVLVGGAADDRD